MNSKTVNCSKLDKAHLLFNMVKKNEPLGMGYLAASNRDPVTLEEMQKILDHNEDVDYVVGRSIKVNFGKWPNLDPAWYDRDYGKGALQDLVNELEEGKQKHCPAHQSRQPDILQKQAKYRHYPQHEEVLVGFPRLHA